MKVLSRHPDTAKAFAYLLKQWDALNGVDPEALSLIVNTVCI